MASEPIGVGVIGLGRSGWNIHINALRDRPDFKVAAVADPMADRQAEARDTLGCSAYSKPEEVISDPNVRVIVVATPSHTHASLATAGLRAGKDVVVEKPMAQNTREMDEMITAAKETNQVLTCYQPRRLEADFLAIQDWIRSGKLGRVVLIRRAQQRYQRRSDWQMLRKYGGGELSNTGPHLVDQVICLLESEITEVFADLQHTVGAGDAEDHVKVCFKTRSGATADVEVTLCAAISQPEWYILGTTGAITGNRRELRVRWYDASKLPPLVVDEGPAQGRKYGGAEAIDWQEEVLHPENSRPPVQQFYNKLHATLTEGAPIFVTPESSRQQIDLIEKARMDAGFE